MRVIVQIWDAQNQEVTRRVGATSRRIASKIAEVLHDGKTAEIVPKADSRTPRLQRRSSLVSQPEVESRQRFANETRKRDENKRDQSSSDSSGFLGFFRSRGSLITVWLEVGRNSNPFYNPVVSYCP